MCERLLASLSMCHQETTKRIYSILLTLVILVCAIACSDPHEDDVVTLNERAYQYRYRNLDSTSLYANRAMQLAGKQGDGYAEALNHLAFVHMARMEYGRADSLLAEVRKSTNNQIELLVADVQLMRLCQRCSKNKDFYVYRESAMRRLHRIEEEYNSLDEHQKRRMIYAESEFYLTTSTYFYYVGLEDLSLDAINQIDVNGEIAQDTSQLLNYLYNVGAGGIILDGTREEINQVEFEYLTRCYVLAKQHHYPYWEANSMQAMSEHLQRKRYRDKLIRDNLPSMQFINPYDMPDSLLAGNLAQRSLKTFIQYGDVYQIAGSYRTLAECYWELKDYKSALICLHNALETNHAINQAPDLVASIREQLSLAYSAIDDKQNSDYNRNLYLDIQEGTRQDRQLEARAEQLDVSSKQLNRMILAIIITIVVVCLLLFIFYYMRKRNDRQASTLTKLMEPLEKWKHDNEEALEENQEKYEEIEEEKHVQQLHVSKNKKRNLEQRTKVSLVNSIIPLIDRMLHEIHQLTKKTEAKSIRDDRYTYIAELAEQINDYNSILTHWIQLRQGVLSLRIESFPLQDVFNLLSRSRMSFSIKGIDLQVMPTQAVVKADKTLTVFMLNTLADNAKKFTPSGGQVRIDSKEGDDYVEIRVEDTGVGMSEQQIEHLFVNKPIVDHTLESVDGNPPSHRISNGFGLMNCKGIIDRYRKTSKIFNVCTIRAESVEGKGSTFAFRLPKGVARTIAVLCMVGSYFINVNAGESGSVPHTPHPIGQAEVVQGEFIQQATAFADSAYFSNIQGTYQKTLLFADSCLYYLNRHYRTCRPHGVDTMTIMSNSTALPAEIKWLYDSIPTNYNIILGIRNESAVAALALHKWALYAYNNKAYTQLFRERSADSTLGTYVQMMQRSEVNKNVALVILSLIFMLIFPAYYFLYDRHRVYYRFSVDRIQEINQTLLSEAPAQEKLQKIQTLWTFNRRMLNTRFTKLNAIVEQIMDALRDRIHVEEVQTTSMELAQDELRRTSYENDQLHISNSVLDNCLSTLKHETMYYPAKIGVLADGKDENLPVLSELSSYYKDLYMLLSAQAMRQIDNHVKVDDDMLRYLFDILKEQNGGELVLTAEDKDPVYCLIHVKMNNLHLSDEQVAALFTPNTVDMQFMLCRQIVREVGEATNARGCGIQAVKDETGRININITLTKTIWKNLKLS